MKKIIKFFLVSFFLSFGVPVYSLDTVNLIPNPNFEEWDYYFNTTQIVPVGWENPKGFGHYRNTSVDLERLPSGNPVKSLVSLRVPTNGEPRSFWATKDPLQLSDKNYSFSAFVKKLGADQKAVAYLTVVELNSTGIEQVFHSDVVRENSNHWQQLTVTFRGRSGFSYLFVLVLRNRTTELSDNRALFDDTFLMELDDSLTTGEFDTVYKPYFPNYGSYNADVTQFPWANNKLGILDAKDPLPFPWTSYPIQIVRRADRDVVKVWGRTITLMRGPLPGQVWSLNQETGQEEEIFSENPRYIIQINGRALLLNETVNPIVKVIANNKHYIERQISYDFPNVKIEAIQTIEFDGFIRNELYIRPKTLISIDKVAMRLPLKKSKSLMFNKYLDFDFVKGVADRESIINATGFINTTPINFPFNPFVWIGDHNTGLEFMMETDIDVSVADPNKMMQIIPKEQSNDFYVNFIDQPMVTADQLVYSFALMPTPSKPGVSNWRQYAFPIIGDIDSERDEIHNFLTNNANFRTIVRTLFRHSTGLPLQYPGLPNPIPATENPLWNAEYFSNRQILEDQGMIYQPYTGITALLKVHPAADAFRERWEINPTGYAVGAWGEYWRTERRSPTDRDWISEGDLPGMAVDFNPKSLHDFFVHEYYSAATMPQHPIKSFYADIGLMHRNGVQKYFANSGRDLSGKLYYPLFGYRELLKRIWVTLKKLNQDFFIEYHMETPPRIFATWSDSILAGEVVNAVFARDGARIDRITGEYFDPANDYRPFYSRLLPESYFASTYPQTSGYFNILIPEIVKDNKNWITDPAQEPLYKALSREMLAKTLVYDIPIWMTRAHRDTILTVLKAKETFGWGDPTLIHLPWYKATPNLIYGQPDFRAAFYGIPKPQNGRPRVLFIGTVGSAGSEEVTRIEIPLPMDWIKMHSGHSTLVPSTVRELSEAEFLVDPLIISKDTGYALQASIKRNDFVMLEIEFIP